MRQVLAEPIDVKAPRIEVDPTGRIRSGRLGVALVALAVALAANSLLGPIGLDRIDYPVSETMRNQTIGLDAVNLLLVVPMLVTIGLMGIRGNRGVGVLALAPTAYVSYMFVQYVAGPDHLVHPRVLILQLGLFACSWVAMVAAWRLARSTESMLHLPRVPAAVLWGLVGFVVLRYVPILVGSLSETALSSEAASDPAMFWLIVLLDLGVFVPTAALAALGVRRASAAAADLGRAVVTWFALVTVAVFGMMATMLVNGDAAASIGMVAFFALVGLVVGAYAFALHRPILRLD